MNAGDDQGRTALHYAVAYQQEQVRHSVSPLDLQVQQPLSSAEDVDVNTTALPCIAAGIALWAMPGV